MFGLIYEWIYGSPPPDDVTERPVPLVNSEELQKRRESLRRTTINTREIPPPCMLESALKRKFLEALPAQYNEK